MLNRVSSLVLAAALMIAAPMAAAPVHAQIFFGQEQFYDVFVDRAGRRFLVHPETGEVVGRAERNARFTRRDKERAERELRRESRRGRLQEELGSLFGILPNDRDPDLEERRPRRFFQREPDRQDNRRQSLPRRQQQPAPATEPLPKQEELARLPEVQEPVQRAPQISGMAKPNFSKKQMAELQIFLDREGFSPGSIDGSWGSNVAKAAAAWKEARGGTDDIADAETLRRLMARSGGAAFTNYTITKADVAGPFARSIPNDYSEKAKLPAMSYTSVVEMLAERFHMSPNYLTQLNPGKNFNRAGTVIEVVAPGQKVSTKVHYIVADKSREQVRAFDRNGKLVAAYPATIGSADTPSPTGTHSVERVAVNPEYTYNPKINFTQGNNKEILRIPPGPNGPVGSVWIALSKPTYGIHGTPSPETIGKTNSHGCIRLTNWDALELAKLVSAGVTVEFVE